MKGGEFELDEPEKMAEDLYCMERILAILLSNRELSHELQKIR
jgi:hypothetical protein